MMCIYRLCNVRIVPIKAVIVSIMVGHIDIVSFRFFFTGFPAVPGKPGDLNFICPGPEIA